MMFSTDLVKVFSFTGFSTLIKLITSYITIKLIASIIGPAGIALVGQFQNFISIFTTFGAGGINNGVVKYISEFNSNDFYLKKYLSNGLKLTAIFSGISGLFLIILSVHFSRWILFSDQYFYLFILFGFSLILTSFNNFFLSVINGLKKYKKFVTISIFTNIISLLFTTILVWKYKLSGALVSLVTSQGIIFLFTVFFLKEEKWFSKSILLDSLNKTIVKQYLSYVLMASVTALTLPVSQLLIRGFIIKQYSITEAGYWEAINKISSMYLMFITSSLSVYYLPKLSEISDISILRKEIFNAYKIITPIVFVTLVLIFILKSFVVKLIFTKSFYPMENLFLWQLIGDFFKILSWLLAFIMVAKSMTKLYIITEILFASVLVLLTFLFININGVIGSTQAYCLNYFLYFILMIIVFRKTLYTKL